MVVGTELVNELTIGLSEVGRGALRQSEAAQISWAFLFLLKRLLQFSQSQLHSEWIFQERPIPENAGVQNCKVELQER